MAEAEAEEELQSQETTVEAGTHTIEVKKGYIVFGLIKVYSFIHTKQSFFLLNMID